MDSYIFDGYNLMHALGLLGKGTARRELEAARRALLERLHARHAPDLANLLVVFDAAHARPGAKARASYRGIPLLYALRGPADDAIEDLLKALPAPHRVAVVSDDRRVREAARRRGCVALGCLDYWEGAAPAANRSPAAPPAEPEEKPAAGDPREWLDAFGDIDDDPRLGSY